MLIYNNCSIYYYILLQILYYIFLYCRFCFDPFIFYINLNYIIFFPLMYSHHFFTDQCYMNISSSIFLNSFDFIYFIIIYLFWIYWQSGYNLVLFRLIQFWSFCQILHFSIQNFSNCQPASRCKIFKYIFWRITCLSFTFTYVIYYVY